MSWPVIEKRLEGRQRPPNVTDYDAERQIFSWCEACDTLAGLPGGGVNIAYECLDRHVAEGEGERTALRFIGRDWQRTNYSYAELCDLSHRFAAGLDALGVRRGDAVFSLLGRCPELYVTVLGTLQGGRVFCPLFSAFGPEPVHSRLSRGNGRVLVTTERLYRSKVAPVRDELPDLEHVILIDAGDEAPEGTTPLAAVMPEAPGDHRTELTDADEVALLHFTSGTTGPPKGALHVHGAVAAHHVTGHYALDFHPGDVYWCTADPGWVTGISYGVISPLTNGVTVIVDEEELDPARWYRIIDEERVAVWYTAPTAIRILMRYGEEPMQGRDLSSLRHLASVGEPLNPEAVVWSRDTFGTPFHDNWWQTETGGIMIANLPCLDIRPGSMGMPLPGIEAAIVRRDEAGGVTVVEEADTEGELALRKGWPSMFRGYLGQRERYERCFADGWYLSGDLARQDADGYFWFVGRGDDVIKSAGHLISPFEVESALMEHPAVSEAAVIGVPDEIAMETVKAFVRLAPGREADDALVREVLGFARKRLGAAVAPRSIEVKDTIPKTRSGKIMRRLLKARELGLPEGDTSTLETND